MARRTEGAVDPTVGGALRSFLGMIVTSPRPRPLGSRPGRTTGAGDGMVATELDAARRTVRIPAGTRIDLGSSAKALAADRAARRIAAVTGSGVLVSLGGDVSWSPARSPGGGWAVGVALDSSAHADAVQQVVAIDAGGLATSSTAVRALPRWWRGLCNSTSWTLHRSQRGPLLDIGVGDRTVLCRCQCRQHRRHRVGQGRRHETAGARAGPPAWSATMDGWRPRTVGPRTHTPRRERSRGRCHELAPALVRDVLPRASWLWPCSWPRQ